MFFIAHRANNNHKFSENSKNAIVDCINTDYIDGVEIDVRITRDKKLVLIHDPVIDFISDGHGIVKYMTLTQLRKYKYGKNKVSLTTLEEVLEMFNHKILLIELKEIGNDYIPLVEQLISLINIYSTVDVYVCSFNFQLLNYLKKNYPKVRCGLIIGYGLNKLKADNNFDFLVISANNLQLLNKKNQSFVFGIKAGDIKNIKYDNYLITDESYKLSKIKKDDKIMHI